MSLDRTGNSGSLYVRNRKIWKNFNAKRIRRAFDTDPLKSELAFSVIPYLLHTNHPDLPGFVENEELVGGIYLFETDPELEPTIRKYFPRLDFRRVEASRRVSWPSIHSLLLMGSIGTVAQTKNSDYDYWVVIDEKKLGEMGVKAHKYKLNEIEKWADEKNMEVHFFPSDIEKTKKDDFGETDKESAGSSHSRILKEEFYRTAILTAGKDPLWWILPPGLTDEEYEEHKNNIKNEGELGGSELVDLGNVGAIPLGELFGALLWQFNKAMSNPYKSVLKMALLQSLITKGSGPNLLCDWLKTLVQEDKETSGEDPYMLMFEYARDTFLTEGRKADAKLLEKCFFIKTFDEPVTDTLDHSNLPYKERATRECLRQWKWSTGELYDMNKIDSWDFQKINALATSLHQFMIETYKNLSDRVSQEPNVKSVISAGDLNIMGRKLYTLYSMKDKNKVEHLKRVKSEIKELDSISFAVTEKRGMKPVWNLYKGNISSALKRRLAVDHMLLKKSMDPVSLLMWLSQNQVFGKGSFLNLVPSSSPVSLVDLQKLMDRIYVLFPPVELSSLSHEDLLSTPYVERIVVCVNFLSHRWIKNIEKLHILYSNTWGERFCIPVEGKAGFKQLIKTLSGTRNSFLISDPARFDIYAPQGEYATALKKEMKVFLAKHYVALKHKGK